VAIIAETTEMAEPTDTDVQLEDPLTEMAQVARRILSTTAGTGTVGARPP